MKGGGGGEGSDELYTVWGLWGVQGGEALWPGDARSEGLYEGN